MPVLTLRNLTFLTNAELNIFLKKWANPDLFYCLFSVFTNKHHYKFNNKLMWKMSIQYMVPGFKPTTFGTVSSHNH